MSAGDALRLAELLQPGRGLVVPGAANALTARIVEDLGFECVYATGAGIANTYLGVPDLGLTTLTELTSHVAAMADVVEIPVIVDADTGFGNAIGLQRAVRMLEGAGAAAIQLEDQAWPKRCGHFENKEVIATAEMCQKIAAATDARDEALIVARTDARAGHGLAAAIDRLGAYFSAGADVGFLEAPTSADELRATAKAFPKLPLIANMVEGGQTPLLPREELADMGFAMVLYANAALQGAIVGTERVLESLSRRGDIDDARAEMAPWERRQRLVGKSVYDDLERQYAVDV